AEPAGRRGPVPGGRPERGQPRHWVAAHPLGGRAVRADDRRHRVAGRGGGRYRPPSPLAPRSGRGDSPPPGAWGRPVERWRANMMVGRRTVGGWLEVDDLRLAFTPHRIDAWLGGGPWSANLLDVRGIRIVAPNDREFPAGMRRRLAIDTADGVETLF